MSALNAALTKIVKLIILSRNSYISYNQIPSVKSQFGEDQEVFSVKITDHFASSTPAFRIVSDLQTAAGRRIDDDFVSLSIPVEITSSTFLVPLLDRHRSGQTWEHTDTNLLGTLSLNYLHGDHGVESLLYYSLNFKIDKISALQFAGRDKQIVQDLQLLLNWGEFVLRCFAKYAAEDATKVHAAATLIIESFANWDANYMEQILLLCTISGDLGPLERVFPEVFTQGKDK